MYLRWLYYFNRLNFALLKLRLSGRVEFCEGCDISTRDFRYRGSGKIRFGKGAVLERSVFPAVFDAEAGSEIIFGERVWLRGKYCANVFTAFAGARIEIGDDCGFNGAVLAAKNRVMIGKKTLLSWGVSIMDSDLHDLSNSRKARISTVEIGDYCLIGVHATIMPGVKIGSHCIIGANSVVTKDVPDNSIAAGAPARVIGRLDDRDRAS